MKKGDGIILLYNINKNITLNQSKPKLCTVTLIFKHVNDIILIYCIVTNINNVKMNF